MSNLRGSLKQAREAYLSVSQLSTEKKNEALKEFSKLLDEKKEELLAENAKDLAENKDKISASLYQRLQLSESKIRGLSKGVMDLVALDDPSGRVDLRRQLDDGLVLERKSVPLGVLGIIFESRPDAVPQILSLVLKSGNAVVLKGGKEAAHSNRAMMSIVSELNERCSFLPKNWAQLLETREDVHEMLKHNDLIDLVIPRGSNELVQNIMSSTKIPVLGHADGICHIYVDPEVDMEAAVPIVIDAKIQYPSACNALETLLVDESIAGDFLGSLPLKENGIEAFGCEKTQALIDAKGVANWAHEYGELAMSIKIVNGMDEAISHIHQFGSGHTDAILTENQEKAEAFMAAVDSANVFWNASTRFADGFRYGMGAEVGISTAKTHARGPVGLEGLVIYKYFLRGQGQVVADYSGDGGKDFKHKDL